MSGWSHSSQASHSPSGERRGAARKSGPVTSTRRLAIAVHRHVDDRRDRLVRSGVVLADGEEPAMSGIEPQVGVPPRALRGDGDGRGVARVQPVQPAVEAIREDDRAAGDRVGAAAVLVDPGADIERRRGQVGRGAVRRRDGPGRFARPPPVAPRPSRRRRHRPTVSTSRTVATTRSSMRIDDGHEPYGAMTGSGRPPRSDPPCVNPTASRPERGRVPGPRDQVPCCQEATYAACSAVIGSSSIPRAASLRRATSASIASGTT